MWLRLLFGLVQSGQFLRDFDHFLFISIEFGTVIFDLSRWFLNLAFHRGNFCINLRVLFAENWFFYLKNFNFTVNSLSGASEKIQTSNGSSGDWEPCAFRSSRFAAMHWNCANPICRHQPRQLTESIRRSRFSTRCSEPPTLPRPMETEERYGFSIK